MTSLKNLDAYEDVKSSYQYYKLLQQKRHENSKEKTEDTPSISINVVDDGAVPKQSNNTTYLPKLEKFRQELEDLGIDKEKIALNHSKQQSTLVPNSNLSDFPFKRNSPTKGCGKIDESKKSKFDDILNSYFCPLPPPTEPAGVDKINKLLGDLQYPMLPFSVDLKKTPKKPSKTPILSYKEQYETGNSQNESRIPPKGAYQASLLSSREFGIKSQEELNQTTPPKEIRLRVKSCLGSETLRLPANLKQEEKNLTKIKKEDIQQFKQKFDSLSLEEIAELPLR